MSSTKLSEIKSQIAELQKAADDIIKNERIAVIKEIKAKLENFNISIEELQQKTKPASSSLIGCQRFATPT